MDLKRIFDSFSRRQKCSSQVGADVLDPAVPETTRNRVLQWCSDLYGGVRSFDRADHRHEFWEQLHHTLRFRHGRTQLSDGSWVNSPAEDTVAYLLSCKGIEFLDFLEDVFRVEEFWRYQDQAPSLVSELNDLLRIDGLPFALTPLVTESYMAESLFGGREIEATRIREFPRVIPLDSQPMHSEVVEPVLHLLSRPEFAAADAEYLAALEDLRKGDYADCLTKSCSAFESCLKVVCRIKGWPCSERDTANTLIKTVTEYSELDSFFETTLQIVATLRNRHSSSHGAGAQPRVVSRYLASYAVQSAGASMLLVTAASGVEKHG